MAALSGSLEDVERLLDEGGCLFVCLFGWLVGLFLSFFFSFFLSFLAILGKSSVVYNRGVLLF